MATRAHGFEKQTVENQGHDAVDKPGSQIGEASDTDSDHGLSKEEQTRIIRRVDRRLVLTVGAMYCASLMDRTNMGAASIAGMGKELNLVGNQYVSPRVP